MAQQQKRPSLFPLQMLIFGMFVFLLAVMNNSFELIKKTPSDNAPSIIHKMHSIYFAGVNQLLLIYLFILVLMYMIGMPGLPLFILLNIGVSLTMLVLTGNALRLLNNETDAEDFKPYKDLMKALVGVSTVVFAVMLMWAAVVFRSTKTQQASGN